MDSNCFSVNKNKHLNFRVRTAKHCMREKEGVGKEGHRVRRAGVQMNVLSEYSGRPPDVVGGK